MTRQEIERANNMAKNRAINTITEHDLKPIHDKAKSFYGKATVIENADEIFLQSYDTIVASFSDDDKKVHRYWDGRTVTTSTHIKSFLRNVCLDLINIDEFYKLPCEDID